MGESQFSALLTVVVPPIVKLIADWAGNGEIAAMEEYTRSCRKRPQRCGG